ncbi:hypothetical protein GCM10025771_22140 [Niveibacterium umoris]|uniref:Uncharacterized protein n=1 Tax=Niveibacterium umoris TaxID=1193620 RepID=A0A840BQ98_9RHOO|nr:hypothetical protein [Niveibacterium umoris]MBB4012597.1 hypothetical protein [Niveibacterium umoris]
MELVELRESSSPDLAGHARISATLKPANGSDFEVWFEVPAHLADQISRGGNPWVLVMLPYAMQTGEAISLSLPVDPALLENIKGLQMQWRQWHPELQTVNVQAPKATLRPDSAKRTAVFFSGGVDSWFTTMRHAPDQYPDAIGTVDDLIFVHGFDIPLAHGHEFLKMKALLERAARSISRDLIVVRTNLRRPGSPWAKAWGRLCHGAALASIGMLLEHRFGKILIGSSYSYGALFPWGSHPLTDPLFSTSSLDVKHDAAMYDRVEKTAFIANHDVALEHLHVCYANGSADNCGVCAKCIRTMATLQLTGVSQEKLPFAEPFSLDRTRKTYLADASDEAFFYEIRDAARSKGNAAIESAANRAISSSRIKRPILALLNRLRTIPGLWRAGSLASAKVIGL